MYLQQFKKFSAVHRIRVLITVFLTAHHSSLSSDILVEATRKKISRIISVRSSLTFFSYVRLGLPSGVFSLFSQTKTLYALLMPPARGIFPSSDLPTNIGRAIWRSGIRFECGLGFGYPDSKFCALPASFQANAGAVSTSF
jgi:hypothetical protein